MANTNKPRYNKNVSSSEAKRSREPQIRKTSFASSSRLPLELTFIILLLFCMPLLSAELVLKTGEVFICDLITENTYQIKVNWKGKEYIIPRQDIQSLDLKKTGKHISYKYLNFKLNDGSQIKGAIADDAKALDLRLSKWGERRVIL